ncbi:hypothetical protein [Novosphingobium sp. CF614]|uniref:hypothetical protein n=1 Tax=Novosphingobium sp. CF614 TaxID=1884364 RepID=UPI000B808A92|nr:hypothetical protein [Novosphingobium sp. CF614]
MTEFLSLFTGRSAETWINLASVGAVLLHHVWLVRLRSRSGIADELLTRISRLFAALPPPQRTEPDSPPVT